MQTDPDGRRAVPPHQLVRDPQTEQDRLGGIGDREHHRIPDRLDLAAAAGGQLSANGPAEIRHERGRVVVAVRLGQRREPGDVGEDEGGLDAVRVAAAHCVDAPTQKPPGGMYLCAVRPQRMIEEPT
jgi:hypothetical protein